MTVARAFAVALALASSALARTDLAGCTYTDLVIKPTRDVGYASRLYYVPDTGEVCDFLDCGGGRAPPKTTVPGCPLYEGTETYKPSYIDPKTLGNGLIQRPGSVTMATTPVTAAASTSAAADVTSSPNAAPSETATSNASVTILTGTHAASSSGSSSAHASGSSSKPEATSSKGAESSNGSAKTTSPSGAGAVPTAAAVLGPCIVAAIAAGLA
ncbi:hypothetical protein PWT90_02054 [Aphanocladium album]|nr:hypothetical protein PWT90_02054 [Aphanocladium album]